MDSPQRPKPRTRHLTQRPEGDVILVPEENEYQPDSSKLQLSDTFIEALIFGDGPAAAAALIELNELDGEALECLIRLLDDNQTVDVYFPWRLQLRYRRRGKPKHKPPRGGLLTPAEEFIDALAQGDNAAASAVLRDMKILRGGALELMAELLQDDPDSSFPSRLCLGGLAGLFLLPCLGGFAFVRLFSMAVRGVSRS